MAVSRLEAFLPHPVETVWRIVTDYADCGWRSDLERVETRGAGGFTEYAKGGYATRFTVTAEIPCRRWAFRLENGNMAGEWTGDFEAQGGGTRIVFTERVRVKKLWLRPFAEFYLRRQQSVYLRDLLKALEKV